MASSWSGYAQSATTLRTSSDPSQTIAAKRKPQPRQLLSCTKCRERKVKVRDCLSASSASLTSSNSAIEQNHAQRAVLEAIPRNANLSLEKETITVLSNSLTRSVSFASKYSAFENGCRQLMFMAQAMSLMATYRPTKRRPKLLLEPLLLGRDASRRAIDPRTCTSELLV